MLKSIINPDSAWKKTFPKTLSLMFTLILLATLPLLANNVSIDGAVTVVDVDTGSNTADIRFDISWDNSWRTTSAPNNYDGVWVFAKWKLSGGDWAHCTLSSTDGDHTAPAGSTIDAVSDGMGVFIYRSAVGSGSNDWNGAQICWDYGADGVADDATVDVKVFAIEMIYIPQGAYYAGDGMTDHDAYTEERITSAGASTNVGSPAEASGLAANYPNGYNAFWLQKHEVSQGQYADFLNNITSAQAADRYPDENGNYRYTITTGYSASVPDRACNYLSWDDTKYYCDWAALRPMTELEYEKACRGDNNTASGSFAWGNTTISGLETGSGTRYVNDGTSTAASSSQTDNAHYSNSGDWNSGGGPYGPVRCGAFADATSTREQAGSGYYGVLEMTGNLWEHLINDDATAFTGELGDGDISSLPSSWPAASSGKGRRGGTWYSATSNLRVSSRINASWSDANRAVNVGFRAVRASVSYVTNPTTGKIWMDRNLGASQVATSSTDAAAYGDLYQWGRAADGHESRTSGTTSTLATSNTPGHGDFILVVYSHPYDWRSPQNDNLWQGVSGTNNPCPSGYRLPTETEWNNERLSWSSNNAAGAFGSPLKLPVAGRRYHSNGSLDFVGSIGYYWSSTVDGTDASYLFFYDDAYMNGIYRTFGNSVRCIKE